MEYWNDFHRTEGSGIRHNVTTWRFEDQLQQPQALVDALTNRLSRPTAPVRLPTGTLERSGDGDQVVRARGVAFQHAHYIERGYVASYSSEDVCWVESHLDWVLMDALGYRPNGRFE